MISNVTVLTVSQPVREELPIPRVLDNLPCSVVDCSSNCTVLGDQHCMSLCRMNGMPQSLVSQRNG